MPSRSHDISYFAETTARARFQRFGIKQADRLSHLYVIGKTGVGKSGLLELLARSDLKASRGLALVDPHGELAQRIRDAAEPGQQVVYLDATDPSCPFGYNPLRRVRDDKISLAASGLLETFRKLWPDAWGVRMEHVLRNSLYALLERDGSALPDILRLYADAGFRKEVTARLRNDIVRAFWKTEFGKYPERYKLEVTAPIQNKLGALLADPTLRRILVAPKVDLRFRALMDRGDVFIANFPKGQLGEDTASVLGSLLISTIGLAALSRADAPPDKRPPFFLYVDEFQAFTTLSFANMMAELRKYALGLTLAHQHLHQLDPDIRHAVLGNAGTLAVFRVGAEDAAHLAHELQPTFSVEDLINLPNRYLYLKLMIDGTPSRPFSARTLDLAA
ncbi:MAG: type IV secretion system DNA-binding domain-containing protein [Devosia sp.]|nr:type IV secretion system DNA-binding domain-containing protein [Devosia sp.]